jgi:metal-responsive CopG/Arc/MetJ family transcriptional regulator
MSTQISLKLTDKLLASTKRYAKNHGYNTLQEFIRETLREKLFEQEQPLTGLHTYKASETALARNWLTKEEDETWAHLQEET